MQDFALPLGRGLFAAALAPRRPARWFIPRPTRPIAPAWIIVRRGRRGCESSGFASMAIEAVVAGRTSKVQGPKSGTTAGFDTFQSDSLTGRGVRITIRG